MQKTIGIIGTGYVGLITGICFAYLGHKVICVDNDKNKIKKLQNGQIPIYEPGLDEILGKFHKNIEFTDDMEKMVSGSDVIFICVGTPSKDDGHIDMSYYRQATVSIAKLLGGYKVIVNKSTVPVGTGAWVDKTIRKKYKGEFSVVSNPEFLREGTAIKDFLEPDKVVIGVEDERAREIMLDIYSSIKAPKFLADIKSAELIKYAHNAFLATKISFINEIANVCEKTGGDVVKIADAMGMDQRIGRSFLNAGIGFGGSCFPKDIDGFIEIADRNKYKFQLLHAVASVNQGQREKFVKKIKKIMRKVNGKTVGIWGLSFKPNTDDVRKSPAIDVIKMLHESNYAIQAYDPVAMENSKKELSGINIKFCQNAYQAAQNADLLALITDWPEFAEIDLANVKNLMRHCYFLDGRNQFDPENMDKMGFNYEGIGRKQIL